MICLIYLWYNVLEHLFASMRPILNFFWPPRSYFLFLGVQDHNVAQITICGHLMLLIEKKEKHKTFRVCNNQEVIAIYFLIWFHYSFTSKKLNGNFRDPYLKKLLKLWMNWITFRDRNFYCQFGSHFAIGSDILFKVFI